MNVTLQQENDIKMNASKLLLLLALFYAQILPAQEKPNSNTCFSAEYIAKHKGKTLVEIPEVSELVNIIMALHPDAEKEKNMFDTDNEYYRAVKKHFAPYRNHPIIDTVQKYITDLSFNEQHKVSLFSRASYGYYYTLKMNACAYSFTKDGKIRNNGMIREIAKGWNSFDPMKDISLMEDFAKKSGFRKFYRSQKSYYKELKKTYSELNPVQQMQDWLDDKFGFGYNSYVIYFSPLVNGAHSTTRFAEGDFEQTMMFVRRAEYDEEHSRMLNQLLESRVIFTEIDHNYVNPVSDKYLERINRVFSQESQWTKTDALAAYNTPYKVFNEYMTFAVFSLYVNDHYGKKELEEYLPHLEKLMESNRGFVRFKAFNDALLQKYQENPKISIPALYDYILDWSEKAKASYILQ